ncbi:LysR family transcriptional regulator [Amycolatopsis sp. NPDC004368]
MELRQLEYFVAVIDHGGFGRAARALGLPQPSVSDAVRALEHELGGELLHRLGRGVVTTAAGEALLGPARRALRDRAAARSVVEDLAGLSGGRLEIVAWSGMASHPLAGFIATYRRRFPQVTVEIAQLGDLEDPAGLLADGRYEIAMAYLPVDTTAVTVHGLGRHWMYVVFPPGDHEDLPDPLPSSLLDGMPMVTVPAASTMRLRVEQSFAASGARWREAAVTGHREALVPMVLAGLGASVVSDHRARRAAQLGLTVRKLDPPITRDYALLHRRDGLSPAGRAFVDLVLEPGGE